MRYANDGAGARHPDRVTSLAAIAAVSGPYSWDHPHEESMLSGWTDPTSDDLQEQIATHVSATAA